MLWLPRKPTAGGAGRNLTESDEVAWRYTNYRWLPSCVEERRERVGQVHELLYFQLLGSPLVCYEVDGVETYEFNGRVVWYVAVKRLIKVTAYNERFMVRVVRREPVPLLRIEDVELLSPSVGYVGITIPFNVDTIRRIIKFAEEINKVPNYTADLITVDRDGYSLHVRRMEKNGKRMIETSLVLHFDKEGKLRMDDVANRYTLMSMDLPITLFTGDEA
jgi:hypothetical protein